MPDIAVFIGTYTIGSESDGIYRFLLDQTTGRLHSRELVATTDNPSFLSASRDSATLYCVNEISDYGGYETGAVSAFSVSHNASHLSFVNQVPSGGRAPCYVSRLAGHALVANYVDGTVAALPLMPDGSLSAASSISHHSGTGPDTDRQEGPHAHSITPFPMGRFAVAADLGTDELITYSLSGDGCLRRESAIQLEAGAGPRHVVFHPAGPWLFLLNELNGTLNLCRYSSDDGKTHCLSTTRTLPDDYSGDNICADIHCSADGRFVYCTNRGHESIAVFRFSESNESLERIQIISSGGKHPRNFAITPNGEFLLCANQVTHTIIVFSIDADSGLLTATGDAVQVPMPVCICIYGE